MVLPNYRGEKYMENEHINTYELDRVSKVKKDQILLQVVFIDKTYLQSWTGKKSASKHKSQYTALC